MREISEKRLTTLTMIAAAALTVGSVALGDWRITAGVGMGGALSLLNVYWLKKSILAILQKAGANQTPPRFNSALFVFRYIVIAIIITIAVSFRVVSVAATLVGLLSFAIAILLETIIQVYYLISDREEN